MNPRELERKVAEMQAAGVEGSTATAEPSVTPEAPPMNAPEATVDEVQESATATADATPEPATPRTSDAELKELREKASRYDETVKMQAESHRRNTAASRSVQEAEAIRQQAAQALQQVQVQSQMFQNQMAAIGSLPPELGQQLLSHLQQGHGGMNYGGHGAPQQVNPFQQVQPQQPNPSSAIAEELAQLKKNVEGFAFSTNSGAALGAIFDEMSRAPAISRSVNLGDEDQSELAEKALSLLMAKEAAEPGSVNPHNPLLLRKAVKEVVASLDKKLQGRRDAYVKDHIAQVRSNGAKAPASGQGPSASVRAIPNAKVAGRQKNESNQQYLARQVREFQQLGVGPSTGTRSDI